MRLLIDLNHPAHVHYSKYLIKELIKRGHEVIVTARDRDPMGKLLNAEGIPYHNRGRGANSIVGKSLYFLKGDFELMKVAIKHKPDIFLCFMSPYAAQVSRIFGKPSIVVDDTEHATLHDRFTYPFAEVILTPDSFYRDLGDKHLRFKGCLELNYLHPARFQPDPGIYKLLGIDETVPYVVMRLVAWGGHHDVGHKGLDLETQKALVKKLSSKYKVFISSEKELPEEFEDYRISIPPEKIHHLLAYASMFIGESGTMAGESVVLGTPAIYVNSLPLMGYLKKAQTNGLLFHLGDNHEILNKAIDLAGIENLKEHFRPNHQKHLSGSIDGTSLLVWLLENYPESIGTLKKEADFQDTFSRIV